MDIFADDANCSIRSTQPPFVRTNIVEPSFKFNGSSCMNPIWSSNISKINLKLLIPSNLLYCCFHTFSFLFRLSIYYCAALGRRWDMVNGCLLLTLLITDNLSYLQIAILYLSVSFLSSPEVVYRCVFTVKLRFHLITNCRLRICRHLTLDPCRGL